MRHRLMELELTVTVVLPCQTRVGRTTLSEHSGLKNVSSHRQGNETQRGNKYSLYMMATTHTRRLKYVT